MIQHTYDVQTFDDGNKIIRPALSNEYEALLGCLIDFPDLMERSVDIVIDGEAEIYNTAGNVFFCGHRKGNYRYNMLFG